VLQFTVHFINFYVGFVNFIMICLKTDKEKLTFQWVWSFSCVIVTNWKLQFSYAPQKLTRKLGTYGTQQKNLTRKLGTHMEIPISSSGWKVCVISLKTVACCFSHITHQFWWLLQLVHAVKLIVLEVANICYYINIIKLEFLLKSSWDVT
jgi:hypothetical protein